jgi:MFS family permease
MLKTEPVQASTGTHPHAYRMVAIAWLNQNAAIACIWGSFSVLLTFVEARLHVGRELSTLGAPAVNLSCAICAPFIGVLAGRFSLRLIMMTGAAMGVAGLVLLALSHSFALYLAAYGLLLGPAMAVGVVLPATLVTRWFALNAGKMLGIVTTQLLVAFIPLAATYIVHAYGLPMTYLALAIIPAVTLIATLFVIDHPPGAAAAPTQAAAAHGVSAPAAPGAKLMTMPELLASPKLWGLAAAFIASSTGTVILLAHMVPLARSWGFSAGQAAILLSVQSLAGLVGTLFFGWLADKLGGARTMAIVVFDATVLWILLSLHPSYPLMVAIIAVFGMHSSGTVPVASLAYAQAFGQQNFSSAYGLLNLINLPFGVLCVPVASYVFTHTGSYSGVIIGVIIFLGATCLLPLIGSKRKAQLQPS